MNIRFATKDDIEFIYQSLKDMAVEENILNRFSQTQDSLYHAIFSEKRFAEILVSEINGKRVGLCLFSVTHRNFHLFKNHGIFVHDLWVDKASRRIGIAAGLVAEIRKIAKQRNCDRIEGIVLNKNKVAINFCESINEAKPVDYAHIVRLSRL